MTKFIESEDGSLVSIDKIAVFVPLTKREGDDRRRYKGYFENRKDYHIFTQLEIDKINSFIVPAEPGWRLFYYEWYRTSSEISISDVLVNAVPIIAWKQGEGDWLDPITFESIENKNHAIIDPSDKVWEPASGTHVDLKSFLSERFSHAKVA